MTVCHGDDFLTSADGAGLDALDKALTEKFDTKVLPRIGPPAYGGQASTGTHLGRSITWTTTGYEWEANPMHRQDLMDLMGLNADLKGSSVLSAKNIGKGRRDLMGELTFDKAAVFRQAAGTALHMFIDRPSMQFAMSEVMGGMQAPLIMHELLLHKVARYVLEYPAETWIYEYQVEPTELYVYVDSDWAADQVTRRSVSCAVVTTGKHMIDTS